MNLDGLDDLIAELTRVVEELQAEEQPSLEELIELGRKLPGLTYALAHGTRELRDRVLDLPNQFVLSDERGQDPEESLIESADALRALNTLVERADPAAREYYDHVKHLRAERPLEPGEPPAHEVRTATAADMARRTRATTHVDKEPASLMNDTVLSSRRRP